MGDIKTQVKQLAVSVLVAGVTLATPLAQAADRTLNIYNWSDYIDESVIKDFEEKNGIKVNYDVFDSNEVLETKLLAGSSGYDLVVPSAYFLNRQIEAGAFQELDQSKLPNLKNMWDVVLTRTATYDKDNKHSINYLWGTTGIGYSKEKVEAILPNAPVDSWEMIFNPEIASKLATCGIHVLDAPSEIIPSALVYLGLDHQDTSKESLAKVEALMDKVRPYIKKFHSSEYISALANGDICVAVGFSGDIFQAKSRAEEAKNGVTVEYAIPKEGAQMWFDMMAMPKDAKNTEEAYLFLNYIMEPEVIAKVTNFVAYANGNKASQEFVDKTLLDNKAIYPGEKTLARLYTMQPYDAKAQRLVNRSWTRIKTGQ